MKPHAVVLLGAPGSGKGTQAHKLTQDWGIPHISTGEILRRAVSGGHERPRDPGHQALTVEMVNRVVGNRDQLYELVARKMQAGQLVPDELMSKIVEERIKREDAQGGFILDGFPRTLVQAEFLDEVFACEDCWDPLVLNIDVDQDVLLKRATGRRMCPVCGEIYNLYFRPPQSDEVCDRDGAKLVHRADDHEDIVRARLLAYDAQTHPLIEYYAGRPYFHNVDGNLPAEAIARELARLLKAA